MSPIPQPGRPHPASSKMDHSPGRCSYKSPTWQALDLERLSMLQAIHDERDPVRLKQLKAEFFDVEDEEDFDIRLPLRCSYGYNIRVGVGSMINHNATILDEAKVTIGRGTLLANHVKIYTSCHASDPDERLFDNQNGYEYRYPVTIGDNCWIGGGATILLGVTIGDGVTVAAGAVVTKNVESRCLAAGVPGKVVKTFPAKTEDTK